MDIAEAWAVIGFPAGAARPEAAKAHRRLAGEADSGGDDELRSRVDEAWAVLVDNRFQVPDRAARRALLVGPDAAAASAPTSAPGRTSGKGETPARKRAGKVTGRTADAPAPRVGRDARKESAPVAGGSLNRALAAAMRARGEQPNGDAWQRAKADPGAYGVDPSKYDR